MPAGSGKMAREVKIGGIRTFVEGTTEAELITDLAESRILLYRAGYDQDKVMELYPFANALSALVKELNKSIYAESFVPVLPEDIAEKENAAGETNFSGYCHKL